MEFTWMFFGLVTIAFLSLAILRRISGRENQGFEKYLKEIEGAGEELPKIDGCRYSGFLEQRQITTKAELYDFLEEEVGEWSPFSFFNILRALMLVGVVIACFLFVLTVTARPDLAEEALMLLIVAYTAWCGYAFFSSVIKVDKERSGIAAKALMRAGRIKFSAMELPG